MKFNNSLLHSLMLLRQQHLDSMKNRRLYSQYILLALLVLGVFYPTSINGEISKLCSRSSQVILTILLLLLLYLNGLVNRKAVWCSLAIPIVLVIATLLSPLPNFALGASIYLLPIALIICLDLRDVGWGRFLSNGFLLVSLTIILLGLLIVLDVGAVEQFFYSFYARFLDELLKNMFVFNKPVVFFSSHSIAAFMLFWFFYLTLITFTKTGKYHYSIIAVFFLYLMWMLKSNASIILSLVAILVGTYELIFRHNWAKKVRLLLVLLFVIGLLWHTEIALFFYGLEDFVKQRLSSQGNGFLGRYSSTGVLQGNIQYIFNHPFSPIGLRNGEQLWLCDSGPVEYMLRGSIVLLVAIYFGLYNFLQHNLNSKVVVWGLFLMILFSELGFSFMTYFRFQYLLPFFIAYIHHLENGSFLRKNVEG